MAFVQGFENDIFISYDHRDNSAPSGEKGWVDHFHDQLESRLLCRFGRKETVIWRDINLHGSALFNEQIKQTIEDSAIFLALVSHNYLESAYCKKEIEWFHCRARESALGLTVKKESRFFNVLIRNISYPSWPVEFEGLKGFRMHRDDDIEGKPCGFLYHTNPQYGVKIDEVVNAVETVLKLFPGTEGASHCGPVEAGEEMQPDSKENVVNIFLADTADSLQGTRERLAADLAGEPVCILQQLPPPYEVADHENAVREAMTKAHLSVHLLDHLPGRKVSGAESTTYPRSQVEIAMSADTRQMVWVPKDLELGKVENGEYRGFLESLDGGGLRKANFEFIREEFTELPRLVRNAAEQIRDEFKKAGNTDERPILLDSHLKDRQFAFKLAVYLEDHGVPVEFCQESRDPVADLHRFEEALRHVGNLVIVFGQVNPVWVVKRAQLVINYVASQVKEKFQTTLANRWICRIPHSQLTRELENLSRLKDFQVRLLDHSHSEIPDCKVLEPLPAECRKGVIV